MIFKTNNLGMTLMETLIYLAIIGILIVGLMSFGWTVTNGRNKTYVSQEVQANVRLATNLIKQKIRASDGILSPTESNSADTLVIDMPNPEADIIFDLNNGVFQITQAGNIEAVTSDRVVVTDLNFTNLAASGERASIRITMTISYNSSSNDKTFNYSQAVQFAVSLLD